MQQDFSHNSSLIRIAIVAKSRVVRTGLESMLSSSTNLETLNNSPLYDENLNSLEVVGSLANLDLQQLEGLKPDVVLIFWEDGEDESIASLKRQDFDSIALFDRWQFEAMGRNLRDEIDKMLRAGVRAILDAEASIEEITKAIETVAIGLIVIDPDFMNILLTPNNSRALSPSSTQSLTNRELEVLAMLAEGLGNKNIASRLNISEHTVKFHISSIFTKLDASSRTEAAIMGARQGLIVL
jgi:NarL family two-component system response regulator YdfI